MVAQAALSTDAGRIAAREHVSGAALIPTTQGCFFGTCFATRSLVIRPSAVSPCNEGYSWVTLAVVSLQWNGMPRWRAAAPKAAAARGLPGAAHQRSGRVACVALGVTRVRADSGGILYTGAVTEFSSLGFESCSRAAARPIIMAMGLRRRGRDGAGHGALLRPVVFDLGSTQRQVVYGPGPEQLQANRGKRFDQLATSSTRRR